MAVEREKEFVRQALASLADCGITESDIAIAYVDYLRDYEVVVHAQASSLNDDDLARVARLSLGGLIIRFHDATADERFRALQASQLYEKSRADAQAWLSERNLFADLPLFDPATQNLATYAKSVETYCGVDPGAVLEVYDPHLLTLRHGLDLSALSKDATQRVINAVMASNLGDHGVDFGVTGGTA